MNNRNKSNNQRKKNNEHNKKKDNQSNYYSNKNNINYKNPISNNKNKKRNNSENIKKNKSQNIPYSSNDPNNNKQIKKTTSLNKMISKNKVNKDNKKSDNIKLNKLIFPLKSTKEENGEEEKNYKININLIMNHDINCYKPKNINSNTNLHIKNKQIFFSPNNKNNYNKNNNINLSLKTIQNTNKPNKNLFKVGIIRYPSIANSNDENKNNDLNLRYYSERKINNEYDNKYYNSNINSLSKKMTKNDFYDNKNDINIIKEEKEIENKKSEDNNSALSEISSDFFNLDDNNNSSSSSNNNSFIINNYKKEKFIPKVEVKAEANLDQLFTKNKKRFNIKSFLNKKQLKKNNSESAFNSNKMPLKYLKNSRLNKSNSTKNGNKTRICFIMKDDLITDNKNTPLISLGIKSKKNKNYNSIPNLRKFQTNDTEINKIQDILSHGDKTFSELAYDKGLSDVVNKIPSPNSHRGSKDDVPKFIKNPNENYGPFKSLFSVGIDRKDESSYSSSPCCSRANSSKVVKIITGSKNKNKCKNIKNLKNYNLEDGKGKINKNNHTEDKDKMKEEIIKDKDNNNNINNNSDDNNEIDIFPEPIWSEQDIEFSLKLKNDLNNEIFNKYPDFIYKLIKGVQDKNYTKDILMDKSQEDRIKEFEDDYNLISQMTTEFEKLEENYKKEFDKINDKIFKMSRLTNFILQQSFPNNHSLQNSISSFSQRIEKMDNQYNKEVKNYKKTIQNLIDQLQNLSEGEQEGIDNKLLQELKDIQFSEKQIINTILEKKYSANDKNCENFDKKELIEELDRFKHEEKEYKFSIPQKYSLDNSKLKVIKTGIIKGLFVKVYENQVIDIINKHGTTKRIFPDKFQINFYNNKDIKLRFSNKDEFCFYHVNQTEEFRFPSKGIIIYKFKNGQFEKHYSNYELNLKFSDGSYRIIRKEKELFQNPDGILEFKDKKGNKSYIDSINDIEEELSKSIKLKYKKK